MITAGINKETQEDIYTNWPYKPEILQVFTEVITKEGYKLPSCRTGTGRRHQGSAESAAPILVRSSKKRRASSSFTPKEASALRLEPIAHLPLHIKGIIYDIDFQIKKLSE
ncbi:hypothetical protein DL95DRAFT_417706 [Leptodontidium sp. 2 PMI_412]|nr:hypothetical protein DL95DRAFT_417706 [Leptodontidium sp. 2 PMI_412]